MATAERLRRLAAAARASQQQAADDVVSRDDEIEEADRVDRMGIRAIARETGLSPSQVQRILARRTAERQA